ncbi:MAG TPA: hypothetical protein VJP79_07225 [Nitrososphaera sp.]|nr:hypothetical protein [Nitrososphaera sp.]
MWIRFNNASEQARHVHNNNIIIESEDELATHIKYRYSVRNLCYRCNKPFASSVELKAHKREVHSY